jgi:polyisoprenoid-binding protein YceI
MQRTAERSREDPGYRRLLPGVDLYPDEGSMRFTLACLVVVTAAACSKSSDSPAPSPKPTSEQAPAGHLPAPGSFQVDPTHSTILFKVRHAGVSNLYGWFKDVSGTFTIDADPKKSHVELTVKAASLDTRDAERNDHLMGPDFLNSKQFPELTFKSTSVDAASSGWHITGDLTIHGVTKSVAFDAVPIGDAKDPTGKRSVGLEARFTIARADFGVTFMPEMVGSDIELIIALEGAAG